MKIELFLIRVWGTLLKEWSYQNYNITVKGFIVIVFRIS